MPGSAIAFFIILSIQNKLLGRRMGGLTGEGVKNGKETGGEATFHWVMDENRDDQNLLVCQF